MSAAGKIKKLGVIGDVHSEHHRLKATLAPGFAAKSGDAGYH
jgi:hypothetical protein